MNLPSSTRRMMSAALLGLLLASFAPTAFAQNDTGVACVAQVYADFAHEQRLYRSVLFGQKQSSDQPAGSVRYDQDGNSWIKKNKNMWVTLAGGSNASTILTDTQMDAKADVPVRRGIFETRKALTSDLIPALAQTMRAYTCRLRAVCDAETASLTSKNSTVTVQPVGCIPFTENTLTSCTQLIQGSVSADQCENNVDAILDHERALLTLTVTYDAAYRTLLQFEGVFEGFLNDFQFPLLNPLWQTVRAIGAFANIPCFLSQCDQ